MLSSIKCQHDRVFSHWREMTALALSVLRGIVENGLEMEKVYVYLPQVNAAFSNIFVSILLRSSISRQRLFQRLFKCQHALGVSIVAITYKGLGRVEI